MKNRFFVVIFCALFVIVVTSLTALAAATEETLPKRQRGFILPKTELSLIECKNLMLDVNESPEIARGAFTDPARNPITSQRLNKTVFDVDILGCGIKTGDIKLWMVPFYIRFFLEFVIGVAGLLAVAGLIYGGYLYLFAGISDDKDKGKNAIKNALIGLVLTLTAWAIVNIVIALVTL